jgi:hypothetical protein
MRSNKGLLPMGAPCARTRDRSRDGATKSPRLVGIALNHHSGGATRLSERSRQVAAQILALRDQDLWPPIAPSVVLIEDRQVVERMDAPPLGLVPRLKLLPCGSATFLACSVPWSTSS